MTWNAPTISIMMPAKNAHPAQAVGGGSLIGLVTGCCAAPAAAAEPFDTSLIAILLLSDGALMSPCGPCSGPQVHADGRSGASCAANDPRATRAADPSRPGPQSGASAPWTETA